MLAIETPAKINLSLEVLGRRPDGYHDLVSVMQAITICDRLVFRDSPATAVTSSDRRLQGADNLVRRAIEVVRRRHGEPRGCAVHLEKRIPLMAGLGGGSSDAAAALVGSCRLWQIDAGCSQLLAMAEELGSDVPFFLTGGTALVEGRGERVTPLPSPPEQWYLLVKPPLDVSTRSVFQALPSGARTDGALTRLLADSIRSGMPGGVGINSLQDTLFDLYPPARACFEAVDALAPGRTLVSGSGPTVVALFLRRDEACEAARALVHRTCWVQVATQASRGGWQTPCA
jgi:4-diphosphocytidyl-2-C-methyl-D-erythritol kinase